MSKNTKQSVTLHLPIKSKTKDDEISELREQVLHYIKKNSDAEDGRDATQDLIDCARGTVLILRSLVDHSDELDEIITSGIANALKIITDHADVAVFNCAGELCDSVDPDRLAGILEAKAAKLREKAKGPDVSIPEAGIDLVPARKALSARRPNSAQKGNRHER